MYARAVEDASTRLRELRSEELGDLGLALAAFVLALAASRLFPALALPLFLGGVVVGFLGIRALWQRWDLVERLSGERDAYVISEVWERARREATASRRHTFAVVVRELLGQHAGGRVESAREELARLADDLEDETLDLDPACAVACLHLLSDFVESPLFNPELPEGELRWQIRRIRSGFSAR